MTSYCCMIHFFSQTCIFLLLHTSIVLASLIIIVDPLVYYNMFTFPCCMIILLLLPCIFLLITYLIYLDILILFAMYFS